MPRKPRKPRAMRQILSTEMRSYFENCSDYHEKYFVNYEEIMAIWTNYREEIISDWILKQPCSRPWAWWAYDAPRWVNDPFKGWWLHGTLPEPRQRLGGIGIAGFEVLNLTPNFDKGIPKRWITKFEENYYNGRKKDIHGKPIGTDFKGKAIDPNDPPFFESEAAYLDRHGVLTETEEKYLVKHSKLLEPERIEFDEKE